ncbi:MAG: SEC-C metal-binding domain-containing protein [Victivallaceae bacterium]
MLKKPNRNDPCPCGSGKKYKQCCLIIQKPSSATHTPQGRMKFSAEVISSSQSNYVDVFKKISSGVNAVATENKTFSITKEKSISKKNLKKIQKKEEAKISENLNKYSFEVLDSTKKEDEFLPATEDFSVSDFQQDD